MTGTPGQPLASAAHRPVRTRRPRRWWRAAVPFLVLVAVWLGTGVAHAVEEPNRRDPGTLSPLGTGPDGSSELAERLRAGGVRIDRVESSQQAQRLAAEGEATIFVPSPDFLVPGFLTLLRQGSVPHRVIVVQPGLRTMLTNPAPIYPSGDRWATATVDPGCPVEYARRAGAVAMRDMTFDVDAPATTYCYRGGLAGVLLGATEYLYVGASDPFRNSRIREAGNAVLATELLSRHGRVIWVDLHAREPVATSPVQLPGLPEYRRGDQDRGGTGNPTIDAFPTGLWAALLVALASAVLFAIARARRLGGPVAEPLPVLVPAAEAVAGRGRLYQRIAAREATLDALRTAAIARLVRVLYPFGGPTERDLRPRNDQPPGPAAEAFVRLIAERTGQAAATVSAILYGQVAADDASLASAVADLDLLVQSVLRDSPSQHREGTP